MKKIITHDSGFHTDDVFAVATLLLVEGEAEVIRSRDPLVQATGDYLVDTGMKYDPAQKVFDHHQPGGAGVRPNGIPYASFGLVWKEFGEKLAGGKREAEIIENKLVMPVDAGDNGVSIIQPKFEDLRPYDIGDFFSSYIDKIDPESINATFRVVSSIAKDLLAREISWAKKFVSHYDKTIEYYEKSPDKRLVVMDESLMSWKQALAKKPEVLYVIHPRTDGNWTLGAVQTKEYVSRKKLPESWGGLEGGELQKVTGVSDAVFCHRALFMASAKTKEGALKLAQIALQS